MWPFVCGYDVFYRNKTVGFVTSLNVFDKFSDTITAYKVLSLFKDQSILQLCMHFYCQILLYWLERLPWHSYLKRISSKHKYAVGFICFIHDKSITQVTISSQKLFLHESVWVHDTVPYPYRCCFLIVVLALQCKIKLFDHTNSTYSSVK